MTVHLLSKGEAAAAARISTRQLDRLIAEGRGPRVTRIGARVLIAQAALDAWLGALAGQPEAAA